MMRLRNYLIDVLLVTGLVLTCFSALAQSESAETVHTFLATSTPMAIAFILSVTAMKISAFVMGYLIVKLGHDTLIKGVSGEIDFGFSGGGVETKLKSASPGAIFVLAGAAVIMWGLFVEKPLTLSLGAGELPLGSFESTPSQNAIKPDENLHKNTPRILPIE